MDEVFRNGPSKNCGKKPAKKWPILEYFIPYVIRNQMYGKVLTHEFFIKRLI